MAAATFAFFGARDFLTDAVGTSRRGRLAADLLASPTARARGADDVGVVGVTRPPVRGGVGVAAAAWDR